MSNHIRPITAVIVSVLIVLTSCSRPADDASSASWIPEGDDVLPIAVEGMRVTRSLLVPDIRGAGIAEGIREAWVISETEGLVRDVRFSLGDRVAEGQTLVVLDSELALRNRDLALQQYNTARLEYEAAEKSSQNGSISQLQFSQTTDRLLAAEAARAAAIDAYENTILKAPFSGAVASRDRSVGIGNYLTRGVRVARIIDDRSFRTEIGVGEGQVLLIEEGAAAAVTGGDGVIRSGRVTAVSAGSEGSSGSYTVVVEWTPETGDRLRSGMTVDVSIQIDDREARIVIPASAIRVREGRDYAFIDRDGTAELRMLSTGSRLGERVEILDGLSVGETLITSGLASLTPDAPVKSTVVGDSGAVK